MINPRVFNRSPKLILIPLRRPSCLRYLHLYTTIIQRSYRRINRINLSIQHVIVIQIRVGINSPRIWLKQHVLQRYIIRVILVCKVRIHIDQKR
ncbi:hypothetical protein HanRHA438_Chr14g0650431 [Helianthus annuus]|nr:hypothetical protein HanRHA438_Chr14g0650431 [Helianthus annuus]